jgi:adenylate cyclase class 1
VRSRQHREQESFDSVYTFLWSTTLYEPQERIFPEIQRFLELHRELAEADLDGSTSEPAHSRLAVLLSSMIRNVASEPLRAMLLPWLVQCGCFGVALAAGAIIAGPYSPKELDKLLSDLPPQALLDLLEKIVKRSEGKQDIQDWAIGFLDVVADQNREAVLWRLENARNDLENPSYALERAALEGGFGRRLRQLLDSPESLGEMVEYVQAASILPSADIADALMLQLEECSDELAPDLLKAMAKQSSATPERVKAMVNRLSHKNERIRIAALDGLLDLRPPNIGPLLARIHAKLVGLRGVLLTRVPLLTRTEFNAFIKNVPADERPELLYRLFHLLTHLDSEPLKSALRMTLADLADKRPAQKTIQFLESLLPQPKIPRRKKPAPPLEPDTRPGDKNCKDSGGLLGGLFGKSGKKAQGKQSPETPCLSLRQTELKRTDDKGRLFHNVQFEDAVLEACHMESAYFESGEFTRCVFRHMHFQQTAFVNCAFNGCSFESCDLSESHWHGSSLQDVSFSHCVMDRSQHHQNQWRQVLVEASTLLDASLTFQDMLAVRLSNVDLTEASLNRLEANGLELAGCLLHRTLFFRCRLENVTTWALSIQNCGASGLDSFHPLLLALENNSLRNRIDAMTEEAWESHPGEQGTLKAPPPVQRLAGETLSRWFTARDFKDKLKRFMACNIRREEWCKQKLGQRQWKLYKVLPLLLASTAFDKAQGLFPAAPPCKISNYAPDYTTVRIAQELFPEEKDWLSHSSDALVIDALFTIGSVGTVAQNESSDLDYWVCAKLSDLSVGDREALADKLELLTDWSMEQFDMEAYFFLMDNEDVRRNNFGFSDKESSGSAQAMMLKEEFYRTAVLAAGKYPVWWFTPPGAGAQAYKCVARQTQRLIGQDRVVDLGRMAPIPPEEFFGAALWQIVKGLKSPFKSIMKFGLLERYTIGCEGADALLCDRIKRSLHAGAQSLWDIDPYVVMFREILEHYERSKDRESARLAALSFHLKARLHEAAAQANRRPANRREKDLLELVSKTTSIGRDSSTAALASSDLTFEQLAALSGRVNQFMTKTYTRVRQSQAEGAKLAITPEDLTKLGRKIFATFSRRRHKVERSAFLNLKAGFFNNLHVAVHHEKKGRSWELIGGQMDEAHGRVRLSKLRKGPALVPLLAWFSANKLHHGEINLKLDLQAAPLTPQDVMELLTAFTAFFPAKETFETDIDENLKAERITRAFFVLNLMAPREADAIREVSLVYSTNWGELFCRDMPVDDEVFAVDPHQYLKNHLDIEAPETPAMDIYIPNRSMCPGILLL